MEFETINKRALEIREKYNDLNFEQRGVRWSATQVMAGLVGDIGDLSKIIMAKDGLRAMDDVDTKLPHELSDCLWSLLVIASKYNIDLAQEFMKTMDELEERVNKELTK
ncbi:MAG: nucleotide pyrophosphohydrolase [Candidatus Saccharibacteria bacterium]